jgi:hypothetical protein
MARSIFIGSLILGLVCAGLSQVPDPGILGIHEEPGRIMFYGGSGLLAGLSGLVAVVSGIYLAATRYAGLSDRQWRYLLTGISIVLIALMVAIVIRFFPA